MLEEIERLRVAETVKGSVIKESLRFRRKVFIHSFD